MTTSVPSGWYPDASMPGHERWWDGQSWTPSTRPSQADLYQPQADSYAAGSSDAQEATGSASANDDTRATSESADARAVHAETVDEQGSSGGFAWSSDSQDSTASYGETPNRETPFGSVDAETSAAAVSDSATSNAEGFTTSFGSSRGAHSAVNEENPYATRSDVYPAEAEAVEADIAIDRHLSVDGDSAGRGDVAVETDVAEVNVVEAKVAETGFAEVNTPEVKAPEVKAPEVNMPEVRAPEVRAPEVNMPEVRAPEVNMPEVRAPEVRTPEVRAPEVNMPEARTSEVNVAGPNMVERDIVDGDSPHVAAAAESATFTGWSMGQQGPGAAHAGGNEVPGYTAAQDQLPQNPGPSQEPLGSMPQNPMPQGQATPAPVSGYPTYQYPNGLNPERQAQSGSVDAAYQGSQAPYAMPQAAPHQSAQPYSSTPYDSAPPYAGGYPAAPGQPAGAPYQLAPNALPGYPAPAPDPSGAVLASPWARLGARFLDGLIMMPIIFLIGLPFYGPIFSTLQDMVDYADTFPADSSPDLSPYMQDLLWPVMGWLLLAAVVPALYYIICTGWKGTTPGKYLLGMRVAQAASGAKPTWGQSFLRWLVTDIPGYFLGGLWLIDPLWCLWDDRKQCVHDKAAGTVVVRR